MDPRAERTGSNNAIRIDIHRRCHTYKTRGLEFAKFLRPISLYAGASPQVLPYQSPHRLPQAAMQAADMVLSSPNRALGSTFTSIAPAAAHPSQGSYACVLCRHRKVKCDRQNACSSCTRMRIEWVPFVPSRLPRGRQGGRKKQKAGDRLLERIARLEGLMIDSEALGRPATPPTTTLPCTSTASSGETQVNQNKGPARNLSQ